MVDYPKIAGAASLALGLTLSLYWSARGLVDEMPYPLEATPRRPPEGIVMILSVYVILGWMFSLLAAFVVLPHDELTDTPPGLVRSTSITFALAGILCAAVLRLHSLARGLTLSRVIPSTPTATEMALVVVTLGFGGAVMVTTVGDLRPFIASAGGSPQTLSLIILATSLCLFIVVECFWWLWSQTPAYKKIVLSATDATVAEMLRHRNGTLALELYPFVGLNPDTHLPDAVVKEARKAGLLARVREDEVKDALQLLAEYRMIIPVPGGCVRRNPHYYRTLNDRLLHSRLAKFSDDLSQDDIMTALEIRREPQRLNELHPGLLAYIRQFDSPPDQVLSALLEHTLDDIRREGRIGREALIVDYLTRRFWRGMTTAEIAQELGYSREHFTRIAHRPGLELFKRYLARRTLLGPF